jgi:hypothetical protein
MTRLVALALAGSAAALTLSAAQQPSPLAPVKGGQWELEGVPGTKAAHLCVPDVLALARYEHRGKNCSSKTISQTASSVVVEYSCGGAGFGHSKIDVITPRSLRIDTQGVSDSLPFRYVIDARRLGDCSTTAARH